MKNHIKRCMTRLLQIIFIQINFHYNNSHISIKFPQNNRKMTKILKNKFTYHFDGNIYNAKRATSSTFSN
jgi:hypothetical protein